MPGAQTQHLQYDLNIDTQIIHNLHNLNIDTQIIHNFAHLLHSNVNRSCCGHPSCELSQDRQLSGLDPLS